MNTPRFFLVVVLGFAATATVLETNAVVATNTSRADEKGTRRQPSPKVDPYLISESGIGSIRLEMTLDEARRAVPAAKFKRTSDGDGVALVEVRLAPGASIILWAEEDQPEAAIEWSKRIKTIETFSPAFHTTEGVHPGSLVREVEKVFGKTREIVESEIESRQYISFDAQPKFLTLTLDYTGIFSAGTRRTKEFEPGAKIWSIGISSY